MRKGWVCCGHEWVMRMIPWHDVPPSSTRLPIPYEVLFIVLQPLASPENDCDGSSVAWASSSRLGSLIVLSHQTTPWAIPGESMGQGGRVNVTLPDPVPDV